jgi:hypothetical protein
MSMIYPEDRGMSYSVRLGNEAGRIIAEKLKKQGSQQEEIKR